ncbi:hypothetical protein CPB86DRAFT_686220, partial [Serendipita vermifera]
LGPMTEYTAYEGELVGILLGVHLLNTTFNLGKEVIIYTDSRAAVSQILGSGNSSAKYLVDEITTNIDGPVGDRSDQGTSEIKLSPLALVWIPGHAKIPGNEYADLKAKEAARGRSSDIEQLPPNLR